MTYFFLVRHGATAWNDAGRIQGLADVPLSPLGQAQAVAVAQRLAAESLTLVVTSPLGRARATAAAVATAARVPLRVEPALCEMDFGAWDGLTVDEVRTRDPEGWRRVAAGEDWPNGGGERTSEVQRRVLAAMEALRAAQPEGRVAVVSHLATLRALLCAVAGRALTLRWPPLDAGSITEVRWPAAGRPEIITLNETGHLDDC